MSTRMIAAATAGLAVFATTFAFAAGLGTVTSGNVGAGSATVAACDTVGVDASYASTAWDATDKRYEIASVVISNVADTCDGSTLKVTVTDSTGAQLTGGEGTLAIPTSAATSHTVSLSAGVAASAVTGVQVAIGS